MARAYTNKELAGWLFYFWALAVIPSLVIMLGAVALGCDLMSPWVLIPAGAAQLPALIKAAKVLPPKE